METRALTHPANFRLDLSVNTSEDNISLPPVTGKPRRDPSTFKLMRSHSDITDNTVAKLKDSSMMSKLIISTKGLIKNLSQVSTRMNIVSEIAELRSPLRTGMLVIPPNNVERLPQ